MTMPTPDGLPNNSHRNWIRIVVTCVLVSLGVQVVWPSLEALAISSICNLDLVPLDVKKALKCIPIDDASSRYVMRRSNPNEVTYFPEPLNVDPWALEREDSIRGRFLRAPRERILEETSMAALPRSLTGRPEPWTEAEAVAALQAAKRSREVGNYRRFEIIIEHAYALAPHHPDVLTEYGIFMETIRKNVLEAEGLYLKALTYNPAHSEALT